MKYARTGWGAWDPYFVQYAENNICENCTIQWGMLYCAVLCVIFRQLAVNVTELLNFSWFT